MKVRTRIQWHTEENGVLKWRNPGDITDESVPDLDDLIREGTVEVVDPTVTASADNLLNAMKAGLTSSSEADPAPTVPLKPGKRSAPSAPESEA